MKKIKLIMLLAVISFNSCITTNEDVKKDMFEGDTEQNKNVVYLLSDDNDEFNMYNRAIVNLNNDVDTLFITVRIKGSVGVPKDISVELTPYFVRERVNSANNESLDKESLFYQYNKSKFDDDYENWANFLPEANYSFLPENIIEGSTPGTIRLKATIKQGKVNTTIPVLIKDLHTLSPDSLYFLEYKITKVNDALVDTNKKNVLIPICWKNAWSSSREPIIYDMIGKQHDWRVGDEMPLVGSSRWITGAPTLYPIGKNEIRIGAGIEMDQINWDKKTKRQLIDANSIVLIIDKDNQIDFRPYKDIEVEKVLPGDIFYDENHTNRYFTEKIITTSGFTKYFKTFTLHYRYRNYKMSDDVYRYCKLTLRYEYEP